MTPLSQTPAPPLRLLAVGPPVALEQRLVDWLRSLRGDDPLRPVTIVVGSVNARTHLSGRLVDGLGAHAGIALTSVHGLATRLGTLGGGGRDRRRVGDIARERLVTRIVRAASASASWAFAPVADTPGLPAALRRSFDDLREACLEAPQVAALGTSRAQALAALYADYVARLDELRLADDATFYDCAAQALREAAGGDGTAPGAAPGAVAVFGLYDLPEMQRRLLRAMADAGEPFAVFLPWSRAAAAFAAAARDFYAGLGLTTEELGAEATTTALTRLRAGLDGRASGGSAAADPSLAVISVPHGGCQADRATSWAFAALADGVAAHELAVVCAAGDLRRRIATRLKTAGLPVAARLPLDDADSRALGLLLDCVAPAEGPQLERTAVIGLAGLAGGGGRVAAAAARWDRLARRAGVVAGAPEWRHKLGALERSLERRQQRATAAARDVADDDDASRGADLAADLVALRGLRAFVSVVSQAAAALPRRAPWAAFVAALGDAAAESDVAVEGDLLAGLGELVELDVVEPPVCRAEFAAVARRWLAAREGVEGRVGVEGIAVLSPEQVRTTHFARLLFCDLVDGGFPPQPRPDPFLGDLDRESLEAACGITLPLASRRDAESQLLFALALEATDAVTLVVPRADEGSGRPRLPSRVLLAALRAASGRLVAAAELGRGGALDGLVTVEGAPATPQPPGRGATDLRDLDLKLLALARAGEPDAAARCASVLLGADGDRRRAALMASREPRLTAYDGLLSERHGADAAAAFFSGRVSATAVEQYFGCPFAFLLRRVLRLEVLDEPESALEIEPVVRGSLVHEILEQTFVAAAADGAPTRAAAAAALEAAAAAAFTAAERSGVTGFPLAWAVQRRELLDDLRIAVDRDPCWSDGLLPERFEWRFGDGQSPTVDVAAGERLVRFSGRVDRIDVDAAHVTLRLIDYKTGAGAGERRRRREGRAVQLLVYLLAAAAEYSEARSLAAAYRLVTRRGGFATLDLQLDAGQARRRLGELLLALDAALCRGLFPRRPVDSTCEYCDVRNGCLADVTSRARKAADPALAPLLDLLTGADEAAGA